MTIPTTLAVRLCVFLSLPLAACATASVDGDDDQGAREVDDAGSGVKDPPPPGSNPDAAVIVGFPDASGGGGGVDGGAGLDAGCALETIDLLENGNFDSGAGVAWTEQSSGGLAIILEEGADEFPDTLQIPADSGTFLAYLAGYPSAVDSLQENVTLPADATGVRLRGVRQIATSETVDQPFDNAFVEIQPPGGEDAEELARFTNQDATAPGAYVEFEARANGDYRGQTVTVQVRATTDASLNTHFFFDSLVLEVETCSGSIAAPR